MSLVCVVTKVSRLSCSLLYFTVTPQLAVTLHYWGLYKQKTNKMSLPVTHIPTVFLWQTGPSGWGFFAAVAFAEQMLRSVLSK